MKSLSRIPGKTNAVFNTAGLLLLASLISIQLQAQTLAHSEILGRPTANSIVVQVIFSDSSEVSVQYGINTGQYTAQTVWQRFAGGETAEILITGLQPATNYYYRLCHRRPGSVPFTTRTEHSFRTQAAAGSTFSFVVQADPHVDEQSDSALYRRCLQNQLEDHPDFMIDLGDFLMTDKLKDATGTIPFDTIPFRCKLLRSYYETVNHSVPLFIALGNHEGEAGWNLTGTASNIAVKDAIERKKYFLNPYPDNFYTGDTANLPFTGMRGDYYAWKWGNALFIVLDPYWYTNPKPDSTHGWNWTLGKKQYDWLKATLEQNNTPFKFVFAHQIIGGNTEGRGGVEYADFYEWGGKNKDGSAGFATNRPGWYKPIKDLLAENRVTIFFHGHDHFFARQEKGCLIYQETPQPSHPNFQTASDAAAYGYLQGLILPNSGHLRITVSAQGVRTEYVRAYLPQNENATHHNKDISASYFIGTTNCYDSLVTSSPILWNNNYEDELIYPNPFLRQTTIEITRKQSALISLAIFNTSGNVVKVLLNNQLVNPGKYKISWDGKDQQGHDMPSGIYYYKTTANNNPAGSGKLALLR